MSSAYRALLQKTDPPSSSDVPLSRDRAGLSDDQKLDVKVPRFSPAFLLCILLAAAHIVNVVLSVRALWISDAMTPDTMLWYNSGVLIFAFIVWAFVMYYVKHQGHPRVSGTFDKLVVFADQHYIWIVIFIAVNLLMSAVKVWMLYHFETVFKEYTSYYTQLSLSDIGIQTSAMNTSYIAIGIIPLMEMMVLLVLLLLAANREFYPVYTQAFSKIMEINANLSATEAEKRNLVNELEQENAANNKWLA